nr:hypothetical protein [Streptomyces sp. TLI_235]
MRNSRAFEDAVAQTLAELARRGVTMRSGVVADVIERNIRTVAERLASRSAPRGGTSTPPPLVRQQQEFKDSSAERGVGQAPLPPVGNLELALILEGVPDALVETGGDLYAVIRGVAVNAWMAGHIHGEDGCVGREGSRGPAGRDWDARMKAITVLAPDIDKWFDPQVWAQVLQDSGFGVTRRWPGHGGTAPTRGSTSRQPDPGNGRARRRRRLPMVRCARKAPSGRESAGQRPALSTATIRRRAAATAAFRLAGFVRIGEVPDCDVCQLVVMTCGPAGPLRGLCRRSGAVLGAPVQAPSRRRRHARLIATATELVAECAQAAAAVYGPIADAPPQQEGVRVSLWPVAALAASAPVRLDAATMRDEERWPTQTAREGEQGRTTFRRCCALAEAESAVLDAHTSTADTPAGGVALPTVGQAAAMGLTGAGNDFLESLDDPEEALALLAELTAGGEYTAAEVLDEATHTALVAALLVLQDAARQKDPSLAAERCLHAARQLALVVSVASLDPVPEQ